MIEKEENKDKEKLSAILERPISSHNVELISLASELAGRSILSNFDNKNINNLRNNDKMLNSDQDKNQDVQLDINIS